MSILDKIYNEIYLDEMPDTAEYCELRKKAFAVWEKAAPMLGMEFSDEVWNDLMTLNIFECRHDFKTGFCLGVQLMLEVCSQPGEP